MTCPRCHNSTEQDGEWPIKMPDGSIKQGCHACFEEDADEEFWELVDALSECKEAANGQHS